MKTKRALVVTGSIAVISFLSGAYCFWMMTVPLSYDWVYVVVIGFIVSVGAFIISLITLLVLVTRLRRSRDV